ncbi:c-type cytochrome domain-containing protein [Engelhardtia mirabilis]|uniref:Planctomycete cytochrome C n=1 Tax=Engelhardtia mirabilis TaxID=2528011 RepID=A0A518BIT4_9BACT|nr:Planctomycete cytochrome C [Planctomycetes bacterium Pla133]QDV01209.1 Planctomycete cytochrome C [Planctomycetes bacterium Pla86]
MSVEGTAQVFGTEQWLEFAGRLHPLLLHLPIGLLAAAFLLEAVSAFRASAAVPRRLVIVGLALSAAIAASSGWLLGREADYAGELVDEHRLLGIAVAVVATLVALLDLFGRSEWSSVARRVALVACAGLTVIAGHHGGELTHGARFLSEKAPPVLAVLLGGPPREPAATDGSAASLLAASDGEFEGSTAARADATLVLGALERRCFECHGESKSKGDLRLDLLDGLLSVVSPGAPLGSTIYQRVTLPRDDEDAMPPTGAPLAEAEIAALARWIERGATEIDVEAELSTNRALAAAAESTVADVALASGARIAALVIDLGAPAAERRLEVDWGGTGVTPDAANLAALAPIAERVVELRLAGLDLAGEGLAGLGELPALDRAHLERSSAGDAEVATLAARAPRLRYLNLHSTRVTSLALPAIEGLERLEQLVLFDTALTPADVAELTAERQDLQVSFDGGLPSAPLADRPVRRVLAADASTGRIALLREVAIGHAELLWEHPIRDLHDIQWLGATTGEHGRVLFQDSWTHLLEVDTATDEVLWQYDAAASGEGPVEVHAFRRLEDGTTMVAESGRGRVVFVDAAGEIVDKFPLTLDGHSVHSDTRLVRPTPTGTFLVAHERDGVVREYDRTGQVVWEYDVPLFDREPAPGHGPEAHGDQVFCALRLADGDTLISTGNGSSLLRVRPSGSLRWHLGQDDVYGVRLAWTTALQELSGGNLLVGNCHAGPGQPQAVELTPAGELVWEFEDHELFGDALSNLVVVEAAP